MKREESENPFLRHMKECQSEVPTRLENSETLLGSL